MTSDDRGKGGDVRHWLTRTRSFRTELAVGKRPAPELIVQYSEGQDDVGQNASKNKVRANVHNKITMYYNLCAKKEKR